MHSSDQLNHTVNVTLAKALGDAAGLGGDRAAMVFSRVVFWVQHNTSCNHNHRQDEAGIWHFWTYNTMAQWHREFPFWSLSTLNRIFKDLIDCGIVIASDKFSTGKRRPIWYTINESAYRQLMATQSFAASDFTVSQNDIVSSKSAEPISQNDKQDPVTVSQNDQLLTYNREKQDASIEHSCASDLLLDVPRDAALQKQCKKKSGNPSLDEIALQLLAAFRFQRFGSSKFSKTMWNGYKPALRSLAEDGYTEEQIKDATRLAMQTWTKVEMVNPNSISKAMDSLLGIKDAKPKSVMSPRVEAYLAAQQQQHGNGTAYTDYADGESPIDSLRDARCSVE